MSPRIYGLQLQSGPEFNSVCPSIIFGELSLLLNSSYYYKLFNLSCPKIKKPAHKGYFIVDKLSMNSKCSPFHLGLKTNPCLLFEVKSYIYFFLVYLLCNPILSTMSGSFFINHTSNLFSIFLLVLFWKSYFVIVYKKSLDIIIYSHIHNSCLSKHNNMIIIFILHIKWMRNGDLNIDSLNYSVQESWIYLSYQEPMYCDFYNFLF